MFHKRSGFTLIELLVVIAVIGISVTLAVPSWQQVTQKRNLTSATEQVAALMSYAQTEAQKRNRTISLAFKRTDNLDWCVGASLGSSGCDCSETNPEASGFCTIDGTPSSVGAASFKFLKLTGASDSQPAGGDSFITFDPLRGILQPAGDMLQFTFESVNGDHRLRLIIGPTGLLRICNPDSEKQVGGYKSCVT
jgi:prepilin-type N-terminal cleavage/methylation domain-containing protein